MIKMLINQFSNKGGRNGKEICFVHVFCTFGGGKHGSKRVRRR
jgi:hypothetical protein